MPGLVLTATVQGAENPTVQHSQHKHLLIKIRLSSYQEKMTSLNSKRKQVSGHSAANAGVG